MNTDLGYKTHHNLFEAEISEAKVKLDAAKTAIEKTAYASNTPLITPDQEPEPAEPIYPTDLIQGVSCQLQQVNPVEPLDQSKAITQAPADPSSCRQEQDNAVGTYMEMDRQIKAEFIAELKNVDQEVGNMMENVMAMPGGTSMAIEAAQLVDPGVGDLYSALNALMSKNPNDDRVGAAIDKTLANLQQRTDQQNEAALKGHPPKPNAIDWNKFETPQQVKDFLTRDIEQDPFMQKAADFEKNIVQMEENHQWYHEVYRTGEHDGITREQMLAAVLGGDRELAGNLMGGEKAELALAGTSIDEVFKPSSFETVDDATMFSKTIAADFKGINLAGLEDDVADVVSGGKGAFGALKIQDPKMSQDFGQSFSLRV